MPQTPWTNLAADFYGPLPSSEYLLVVIDEHPRYPIVEVTHSTSANTVIPVLDKLFSMFGSPKVLKTDNGIPWNSIRMSQFATYLGFHHRRITPCWPQANSEAERFKRVLQKTLHTSTVSATPWK